MLPGLVIAALAGVPLSSAPPRACWWPRDRLDRARRARGGDVGVAVVVSGLFGLGGILALVAGDAAAAGRAAVRRPAGRDQPGPGRGGGAQPRRARRARLAYRSLSVAGFEQRGGRADLALLAILGVTTVAAVQGLGNLLLVALILAPAAAALNLANRLPQIIGLAAALAVIAGVAGLVISYQLEIAAGASIALCAVALSSLGC